MEEKLMLDSLSLKGTKENEFFDMIRNFDEMTEIVSIRSQDLEIMYVEKNEDPRFLRVIPFSFSQDSFMDLRNIYMKQRCYIHVEQLKERGVTEKLLKEIVNTNLLIKSKLTGETFLVSTFALSTLCQRAGISGSYFHDIHKNGIMKTMILAHALSENHDSMTLICRKNKKGARKIFSCLSEGYIYSSQIFLLDLLNKVKEQVGQITVQKFFACQEYTEVYFYFPQKGIKISEVRDEGEEMETLSLGFCIATSDTGKMSFTISNTWTVGNSICVEKEWKKKHNSLISMAEILNVMDCFLKLKSFPEKLYSLSKQKIYLGDAISLVKGIFPLIGKAVGEKKKEQFLQQLMSSLSSFCFSKEKLAIKMLELTTNKELPEYARKKLEKTVTQIILLL